MASPKGTRADYQVTVSTQKTPRGYVAKLKVIRLVDRRTIYPFFGGKAMPSFVDWEQARTFGFEYGWPLVDGDIAVPEP
ncbi:protein of unknown function (plasmid) [Pararobbsia alpina]|uniref:DUF6723 family protein n=1 Tax=Pararobbsia alpina TaxID=621374 RepID=UPI0039A47E0B